MQFILTFGANSAASATVKPSTAAFAEEIILWLVKPFWAATVENKTIAPWLSFNFPCVALIISVAEIKFKLKQSKKSFF